MKERSKNRSTLLFILLTGVLVVIAFIAYNKISQFNNSVHWVMHTQFVKDQIIELRSNIKDAESGQRGYLMTKDSVFLRPFIGAEQRSKGVFATLDSLISDNAGQQENLKKLKTLFAERYLLMNKTLTSFKNNPSTNLPADNFLLESNNKMLEVRKQIALLLKTEDTDLEKRIQVKNRSATITPIFLLLLFLFSIAALTLFFFRLQKETSARVSSEKLVEVEAAARKQIEENLREISDYKYALDESSIVAITDQKGAIKYVNDNFCKISKYTRQELIGQDHRIISSGYHSKDFIRNLWTTIADGKLWKGELKNKAKDGTIYWVDTTIVPFLDEAGKPYQYVAIRADITAQKKTEEAIEKMATHLSLATDSANVGTWSVDIKTQKLEWSAVHKRLWGYDEHRTDLTHEDWHTLILPEDMDMALKSVEDARVSHTDYDVEYRIGREDDRTVRCIRSFGKYYYNDKGEAETLTGISIDITEQKEAELKLKASEEKYRSLFETMDQGFSIIEMIFDRDNKPVDCVYIETNPVFEKLTGLKNVTGKTVKELIPNIEEHWFQIYGKVALTGEPNRFVEGSEALGRWFETYAFRLGDQGSNKVAVLFTDITDRKQVEEKIRASEKQFRTFANSIQNLAWIANGDGWIYWYNQQWYDFTGTSFEEMEGWGWEKVHHPDHVERVTELSKGFWKKDEAFELTFPLRRHDGEFRWFLVRAYPVKDANGNIERWVGTNTDIHEQKTKEQQKDEFISIASHEMKTPLTTAKGYLELLLPLLSEENQTALLFANKANQAVERLHSLVTELLDVSKIQNGKLDYNIATFDFNEMINEAIENIQLTAKNRSFQKSGYSARQIKGDKERLQQVMTNLLSNAVKYSPDAEQVIIRVEEQEGNIQVSVQDFGLGIPSQHLDKIFDRYYRVQEHAVFFHGLGIGLHISSSIIQRHEGKMWAESERGMGSTFYFTLPL